MPKSKRARIIHTSVVQKKSSTHNTNLFTTIREAASSYTHILILTVSNMRNTHLKDLRQLLPTSRLFFGKTKVMLKALGDSEGTEVLPGVSGLGVYMKGTVGCLFSNQPVEELLELLAGFQPTDYARAGTVASESFVVPAGVIYSRGGAIPEDDDVPVAHSQESNLKRFGMVTRLEKGKVVIDQEFVVAEEGRELDSKSAALLKIFGVQMAVFEVRCVARYDAGAGQVIEVEGLSGEDVEE